LIPLLQILQLRLHTILVIKVCVIVPVYNHEHAVGAVVEAILGHGLPCILIDDGSSPDGARVLDSLAAATPEHVVLVRHVYNRGKGAAVLTGLRAAAAQGYSHAVQIDADGQHTMADIPRFVEHAVANPTAVIVGSPMFDDTVPAIRFYGRYCTHILVWIDTLSFQIRDSMCGFRVYPIQTVLDLANRKRLGERMDFETAVLVRLVWQGVPIVNVPTRVTYPSDGVSHYRMGRDNLCLARMHVTLLGGMLLRAPMLLWRRLRGSLR